LECKSECQASVNRSDLDVSDIVVMHEADLFWDSYGDWLLYKHHDQLWAMYTMMNPMFFHDWNVADTYDGVFDLMLNYRSDSDVTMTYGRKIRDKETVKSSSGQRVNYARNRTKMVLSIANNCCRSRQNIIDSLSKEVEVDKFGYCGGRPFTCDHGEKAYLTSCAKQFKSQYRFQIALENMPCKEYVTEKLWYAL